MTGKLHEGDFQRLAQDDPPALLAVIDSGTLDRVQLTFAAEACQRIDGRRDDVVRTLFRLLAHDDAVVREGAIYGLAAFHDDDAEVRDRLGVVAATDRSPTIRWVASEALT